jgi:proteasome lid subunit RPN8/RPN11
VLTLAKRHVAEMIAHARQDDPSECCGLLAGRDGQAVELYRMTNVAHSPYRYSMDPKELLRTNREIEDRGWELLAIYHSHTHTEAYPSPTDVRLALWPNTREAIWPKVYYILVSLEEKEKPDVRAFRIMDGGSIVEEGLTVIEG